MLMTTASEEDLREGSERELPSPAALESLRGDARTCASSIALPSPASLVPVTRRVRRAGELATRALVLLDKPGTLVHSQPPTFRQAHAQHKDCAGYFGAPVMRWLRRTWGWFHLLAILPPLYLLAWVTESPLRSFVAVALIAAIWFWS